MKEESKKKVKKAMLWVLDLGVNVVIIFGLVFLIQKWLIAPFDVSGASMCDTLNVVEGECINNHGEKIIINKAAYVSGDPARGDIVVFTPPGENTEKYYIKRVIGLPGETIEIKDGDLYITDSSGEETTKLEENYLNEENTGNTKIYVSNFSVFEIPQDHYFLLGDNRKASTDSRSCFESSVTMECKNNPQNAYVPRDNIKGKTWFVWWPLTNMRIIRGQEYMADQATSESLEEK